MPKSPEYLVDLSRQKRREQTPAEEKLWTLLSGRRLSGLKFRRQHRVGRYIADFYCAEKKLVIELDGGHHHDPDIAAYDEARSRFIEGTGASVLRFSNDQVLSDITNVLRSIDTAAKSR